ncbi:GNAT family N-acetyltransferase [Planktothrix sp. FACHB-1355]|uniref:GNAT family N-acetyltransferase n=1 Tax=Aerosakkonema funiforme FACHB-1375 TaxID=2949571 RepID=A0A926VJA5_9CYAN|nr:MULTISPECIES: GNAT family N-acetyltransferase [Oscillatoriales]MBD2184930.1 GNAT family N-acetyltransferase [Aerosakkonema funiforme FACHB-1375]MBD3561865.1 GNAT family N-acetyltransferase [Planktothrix sp. FACHB-1355]
MNTQIIDLTDNLWLETLAKLWHDIYHLPEYVYLESLRNKAAAEAILIFEDDKIFFLPYLWRRCDGLFESNLATAEVFDVVSPYGYPGIVLSEAAANDREFVKLAINELISAFRAKGFCSAFFRLNPILNGGLEEILSPDICQVSGETVAVNLTLSEAEIWQQTRPEHRTKINRLKRSGMTPKMVSFSEGIKEFISIYYETMDRVEATRTYYFDDRYFDNFSKLGEKVHLCMMELEGKVTCSGIFTECCGIVQYHLGGTRNEFLKQAPTTLMFDYIRLWAKERGDRVFHLGGGVGGGKDSLYHFKAGFSKERRTFSTLRLITDEEKYLHLVNLRAKHLNVAVENLVNSNFFPAYRANG